MNTGFASSRADLHDRLTAGVIAMLAERGYEPQELGPDGDMPDIRIVDQDGRTAYVDPKTRYPHHDNYSLKRGALTTYWRLTLSDTLVYVVWLSESPPLVDNVYTLAARIEGGPRRPTGNGSLTDWLLVAPGGTPFNFIFPPKVPRLLVPADRTSAANVPAGRPNPLKAEETGAHRNGGRT